MKEREGSRGRKIFVLTLRVVSWKRSKTTEEKIWAVRANLGEIGAEELVWREKRRELIHNFTWKYPKPFQQCTSTCVRWYHLVLPNGAVLPNEPQVFKAVVTRSPHPFSMILASYPEELKCEHMFHFSRLIV